MTLNQGVRVVIVSLMCAGVGAAVLLAQSDLGTWKLNLGKSKFGPGQTPKSSSVTFSGAGQGVKAVIEGVGPDGTKVQWHYTANFDGKSYAVTGNPDGDMVVVKRVNATTVESSYTLKGKPTIMNTRVVSADGKTLTITSRGTNAQGQKVDTVFVLEKG